MRLENYKIKIGNRSKIFTLKPWFIAMGNFTTDTEKFNQALTEWLIEYTFVRPHESLLYDTPWQFYAKINKVLPMCPSRTGY